NLRYLAIYGVGTLIAYSIVKYKTPWCIISFIWPFLFIFGAALLIVPLRYRFETYLILVILLVASLGWAVGYWMWANSNYTWSLRYIIGLAILVMILRYVPLMQLLLAIAFCASFGSAIWLNYFHCTTDTEPYVYVQTYNDIYKLTDPLFALVRRNPVYYQLTGHIIRTSAYPLPWMLDDFPHIGYYEQKSLPAKLDAA